MSSSYYQPVPTSESDSSKPANRKHPGVLVVSLLCVIAFVFYWVSWPHPSPSMPQDGKYSIG